MRVLSVLEEDMVAAGGIGSLIDGYTTQSAPTQSGSSVIFVNGGDRDPNQSRINARLAAYIAEQTALGVPRGQAHADFFNF